MAVELSLACDALCDVKRSMEKGMMFDECRRAVEDKDIDNEFQEFVLCVLDKARENASHKRKRKNVYIEDSDGVNDPRYTVNHEVDTAVEDKEIDNEFQKFVLCVLDKARENASHKRKRKNVYIEDSDGVNYPRYMVNHEVDTEELNQMEKGHLYQMPDRRHNRVIENICGKHVVQARLREKEKVCSRVYLQKLRKGKNVIGEDAEANSKTIVQSDNELLHLKPSQKNNRTIRYQNEHVDQARSVGKCKEQMGAKFIGRNKVKVEFKANKKATVMADNEDFHQGLRNNLVVRNHCERADRQPGKKVGQRELIKVGQGKRGLSHHMAVFENFSVKNEPDNGVKTVVHTEEVRRKIHCQRKLMKVEGDCRLSHQQPAFGKFSVKNEPDNGVKTRLHSEEVHNKIRSAKTARIVGQGNCRLAHQKAAFGNYSVKIEPEEGVKTQLRRKEGESKSRSLETSKCPVTYKKGIEMKKRGNVEILPEVEILDSTAILNGMTSPFVPSTTYDVLPDPGCPILDEFRKELLKVLNKPYDEEEYEQHMEEIRIGSFYKHFPDLEKKLTVHQYRPKKCLTIVRGFFFWLQNVCREGAFKPWKDPQCLAIEPSPDRQCLAIEPSPP